MKINFTKKHYVQLLKMLYIADWVVNAHRVGTEDDPYEEEYRELKQYVYSFAEKFHRKDLAIYDKKLCEYYSTNKLEDDPKVRELIDEYDDNTFWDELFYRLVERDMFQKYGKKWFTMSWEEGIKKEEPIREKWSKEISKYGLKRMQAVEKIK